MVRDGNAKDKTVTKHQTPNTKHQQTNKSQTSTGHVEEIRVTVWSLVFGSYLVFGVWCLVFCFRRLVFGFRAFDRPLAS